MPFTLPVVKTITDKYIIEYEQYEDRTIFLHQQSVLKMSESRIVLIIENTSGQIVTMKKSNGKVVLTQYIT